jgi:hypothetical protein
VALALPHGWTNFASHGRRFAVFVLLGPRAPERLVAQAQAALRTLRVRPSSG